MAIPWGLLVHNHNLIFVVQSNNDEKTVLYPGSKYKFEPMQ